VREILRLGDRDGFEAWIARQAWIPRNGGGWRVAGTRDRWSFTLEPVPKGVRVAAFLPAERPWPAVWVVEAG
jgi:hypothetical protein